MTIFLSVLHPLSRVQCQIGEYAFIREHRKLNTEGTALHPLCCIRKTVGTLIQKRMVYLSRISQQNDFSALAHACNNPFHLPWSQILCLVDYKPGIGSVQTDSQ